MGEWRLTRLDLDIVGIERRHKNISSLFREGFARKTVEAARPVYATITGRNEFFRRSIVEARTGKLSGGEDFGGGRSANAVTVGLKTD